MLNSCESLKSLGGFMNLGKAYTNSTANYTSYALDLSSSNLLQKQSLLKVINNLYNIAGDNKPAQPLILGAANLNKLTAEEIAIATSKGWTVS